MVNKIQLRRDTAANWSTVNPILDDGEPAIDITNNKIKYGDGTTVWNDLPYSSLNSHLGLVDFPGDFLIGTLHPNSPHPGGDKESVVWAKDDTEYLGLWWGGNQTYPDSGYGPVAGIMVGASEGFSGFTDDFFSNASPSGTAIVIGINGDSNTYTWAYDRDGNFTTAGEVIIESNNGHGGTGYAGLLTLTNTIVGSSNNNKYVRLNSTGALEIINSAYSTTIFSLTDAGNLTVAGSVKPNNYLPGQIVNTEILVPTDMGVNGDLTSSSTVTLSVSYTPKIANSNIIVEFDGYYEITGSNTDSWTSNIVMNGSEIAYKRTQFNTDGSITARTGVLLPLMGRFANGELSAKTITINLSKITSDDTITLKYIGNHGFIMKITEVAR